MAVVAVTLCAVGFTTGQASATSRHSRGATKVVRWAHPKAHAWYVQNRQDVVAVVSGEQLVYGDMECVPGLESCTPGLIPNPADWPSNIVSLGCPPLVAADSTVRSDGPIPDRQAERWWSTALKDLGSGCQAITAASNAYRISIEEGVTGYDAAVAVPASQAASDVEAADSLLLRVGKYLTRR